MNQKKLFLFILFVLFTSTAIYSQSDLHIFGFYQARLVKTTGDYSVTGDIPTLAGPMRTVFDKVETDYTSSAVQQLNIFARKELTTDLTSFINLEIINNFSSEKEWGALNLEEVWLEYDYSELLHIQAGLIVPKFNYLNEIKNKTPLLPSVMRPLIYESSFNGTINGSEYVPSRAFLQVSGQLLANKFIFDYSAFVGPAEEDYVVSGESVNSIEPGLDSTNFLVYGGRIGLKYDELRLGASFSYDKEKEDETELEDVDRLRLGFDLGYSYKNLFFEGEYIKVMMSEDGEDGENETIDKSFYYTLLGYNLSEKFYAYGLYSKIKDAEVDYLSTGMTGIAGGIGYRPIFSVVVKLEYSNYSVADDAQIKNLPLGDGLPTVDADMDLNFNSVNLALSVMF